MKVTLNPAQIAIRVLGIGNATYRENGLGAMKALDVSITNTQVAKPIIVKNKYTNFISNITKNFLNK